MSILQKTIHSKIKYFFFTDRNELWDDKTEDGQQLNDYNLKVGYITLIVIIITVSKLYFLCA